MCGEHDNDDDATFREAGSSPHVRGAPDIGDALADLVGIIPACAGSTEEGSLVLVLVRDHPRMCGEHQDGICELEEGVGSSPHVRGAQTFHHPPRRPWRIIPACAGSTVLRLLWRGDERDHPRMCGEHLECELVYGARRGIIPACAGSTKTSWCSTTAWRDHPRMCGEHPCCCRCRQTGRGSSPHVRGARDALEAAGLESGIIPACAGSTPEPSGLPWPTRDHPRMCGEHSMRSSPATSFMGSSPHVRGARLRGALRALQRGIIPACAGSTPCCFPWWQNRWDHPRMCGEHWYWVVALLPVWGSSPHVRGAPDRRDACQQRAGIIPACAGSTSQMHVWSKSLGGSSPHVRGAPDERIASRMTLGIIPACAGSTKCPTRSTTERTGSSPHVRGAP